MSRTYHTNPEEEQDDWKCEAQAKADSPNSFRTLVVVCGKHNEGNASSNNEAEIDREVGGEGNENTSSTPDIMALVRGFGGTCTAHRILGGWSVLVPNIIVLCSYFSSSTKSSNTATNNHHPEHAQLSGSVRSSYGVTSASAPSPCHSNHSLTCQDNTKNQEQGCKDDPCTSSDLIDDKSKEQHAEDFSNQIRVGQSRTDGIGHPILVQILE